MSQERWDVVIRFLNGPLMYQGDMVVRGPVVRLGSNPGPGGQKLDGYRALDDRHAVISAYQGGTVQIAPVGPNQVRMSPHENVDWATVQPIRGPVFLSDGCAVHLGPPGRGATFTFVECRRLGVWQHQSLASEASDVGTTTENEASKVKQLDIGRRIPWWFVPGLALMVFGTMGALSLIVLIVVENQVEPLGPEERGPDYYEPGDLFQIATADAGLRASNTGDGYKDFVTSINADIAGDKTLLDPLKSDPKLVEWVTRAEQMHLRGWTFWRKLDDAKETYAMVLRKLRKAKLPDVLAAVPFQESRYNAKAKDFLLCAYGMWQFQPEIAFRNGLQVRGCHNSKTGSLLWEPTEKALPIRAIDNAEYVLDRRCTISACDVDDRDDPEKATDAAIKNFMDPWRDDAFRASGAIVQMTIATHNAGFDDSKYRSSGKVSNTNIGRAYPKYLADTKKTRAPDFIGVNLTCTNPSQMIKDDIQNINNRCDGYLPSVTQSYVPYVIAQHLLAVCYYGTHYSDMPEFKDYAKYSATYCTKIKVPSPDQVLANSGSK